MAHAAALPAGAESLKDDDLTADELYQQAIEVDQFQGTDSSARKLELLDRGLEREPSHREALDCRVNVLLAEGRFEQAERGLVQLLEIKYLPETHFSLCMVRDHMAGPGEPVSDCYRSVATEYGKLVGQPILDFRYLLALKMSGVDDFHDAMKRALLEEGPDSEHWGPFGVRLEMLESDREELLREFLGIQ